MSIIIITVTGTLLSIARIPSWQVLHTTRFGILLSIKIILFLVMAQQALKWRFPLEETFGRERPYRAVEDSTSRRGEDSRDEESGGVESKG
jgi:putative copper export protein